jgi:hypothetical protein
MRLLRLDDLMASYTNPGRLGVGLLVVDLDSSTASGLLAIRPLPRRIGAGADAIATAEQKIADLKLQIDANRDLSTSLAFD